MIEEVRLYHTFGDTEGKLDVLRVECIKCERINVRFGQSGPAPTKNTGKRLGGLRTRNHLSSRCPSGEYRNGKCPQPDRDGNTHEREMTDVYAAGFPSMRSSGDGSRNARHGANAPGGRAGR